jgi:hypothetical protein
MLRQEHLLSGSTLSVQVVRRSQWLDIMRCLPADKPCLA